MKFMKHSICTVPNDKTPRVAANEVQADVLRNVSLLGKTQTVLINAAPDIPDTTAAWLKSLRYAPEKMTEIPLGLDEFHIHWWLTRNNCVNENDELCPDGAPVGVVGARAVNITKGYIKNVTVIK